MMRPLHGYEVALCHSHFARRLPDHVTAYAQGNKRPGGGLLLEGGWVYIYSRD